MTKPVRTISIITSVLWATAIISSATPAELWMGTRKAECGNDQDR